MKYYPYGGYKNASELESMSEEASAKNIESYQRKRSVKFDDIVEDLNTAFQNLSRRFDLETLRFHMKELSLLIIAISVVGIALLYFY